jgi:hypothetical protein
LLSTECPAVGHREAGIAPGKTDTERLGTVTGLMGIRAQRFMRAVADEFTGCFQAPAGRKRRELAHEM